MSIEYRVGDATKPGGSCDKVIAHICNDVGAWGKGFVLSLSELSPKPKIKYKKWKRDGFCQDSKFELGSIQIVSLSPGLWVVNMIAQRGLRSRTNKIPFRADALRSCLEALSKRCLSRNDNVEVHMPRIGSNLSGAKWVEVEGIINETLVQAGIAVVVYDLPSKINNLADRNL